MIIIDRGLQLSTVTPVVGLSEKEDPSTYWTNNIKSLVACHTSLACFWWHQTRSHNGKHFVWRRACFIFYFGNRNVFSIWKNDSNPYFCIRRRNPEGFIHIVHSVHSMACVENVMKKDNCGLHATSREFPRLNIKNLFSYRGERRGRRDIWVDGRTVWWMKSAKDDSFCTMHEGWRSQPEFTQEISGLVDAVWSEMGCVCALSLKGFGPHMAQTPEQVTEDNMLKWEVKYLAAVLTVCDREASLEGGCIERGAWVSLEAFKVKSLHFANLSPSNAITAARSGLFTILPTWIASFVAVKFHWQVSN